jgi:hypothetical protein
VNAPQHPQQDNSGTGLHTGQHTTDTKHLHQSCNLATTATPSIEATHPPLLLPPHPLRLRTPVVVLQCYLGATCSLNIIYAESDQRVPLTRVCQTRTTNFVHNCNQDMGWLPKVQSKRRMAWPATRSSTVCTDDTKSQT